MCEMFSKVHMVFENKHLLERDQKDFETYWQLLSYDDDMIQYHIGIDFKVGPNELVIIDEADALIFRQPDEFQKFTNDTACICFTATPDNQQVRGLEARVITALKFEKFLYVIDAAQE